MRTIELDQDGCLWVDVGMDSGNPTPRVSRICETQNEDGRSQYGFDINFDEVVVSVYGTVEQLQHLAREIEKQVLQDPLMMSEIAEDA